MAKDQMHLPEDSLASKASISNEAWGTQTGAPSGMALPTILARLFPRPTVHHPLVGKRGDDPVDEFTLPQNDASLPGTSQAATATSAQPSVSDDRVALDRLSTLVSGLIEKLDRDTGTDFSGFHALSSSEEEEVFVPPTPCTSQPDPLDSLDQLGREEGADEDFLRALSDLSGHFHGEEKKGDPLSDQLATILNASLRRRPLSESVKLTCGKIKLPSNVPNLAVPVTNAAITKAMSVNGRLVDTKLFQTNCLLTKALVPIAVCLDDIGKKKDKSLACYLDGLNSCLRLLTSAVNYLNQLRKDVARIHVRDSAMVDLCKWECEVGQQELFPFDVTKKCEEIHKAGRLGRPSFRPPAKSSGKRYSSFSRTTHRSSQAHHQSRPRSQTRPFFAQRPPQGRGMHGPKLHHQ
ncbi:uncharacterized protein LOC123519752 [Portunus trituberculatus]|uniref:uncharacterized protein LOC123519752 n=1 Tax=Portunus trituberculatus TaxID=210409 RepID=UPI001E1CBB54|nr:uncharacterized protein LOC123519752 [Portunus trituberculatus]